MIVPSMFPLNARAGSFKIFGSMQFIKLLVVDILFPFAGTEEVGVLLVEGLVPGWWDHVRMVKSLLVGVYVRRKVDGIDGILVSG